MTRIRIELMRVHCGNTEDASGADHLYVVGALSDGITSRGALTSPMRINDNQEKEFAPAQRVLFDADVEPDAIVRGGLKAFDEDFGKDWAKYGDVVNKISDQVSQGLKSTNDPRVVAAGEILGYATKAFGFFASLDKDDQLGTTELNVSAQGPSVEELPWKFSKKGSFLNPGISTWNYTIVYRITRESGARPSRKESDRYIGVWQQSAGPAWVARHGLTSAQYQAVFDELTPQGYRPVILSGYSISGSDRYLCMFEQSSAKGAWVARHGLTGAQYQAVFDDLTPKGYRPIILSGYSVSNE